MDRKRVKLIVEVDLDPVPGAFHTKESAVFYVQSILMRSIPHYDPSTDLLEEK